MRIIIFGTGERCEYLLESRRNPIADHEIIAYSNRNESTWGSYFQGKIIIPPKEISRRDFDIIYVAEDPRTEMFEKIYQLLTKEYGIDGNLIKDEDYLDVLYSIKQAETLNARLRARLDVKENDLSILDTCRIVVYTAIYGNYDYLKEPKYVDPNIDYICFTDNKYLQSKTWKIRYIDDPKESDSRRNARIYKILPHRYFSEYIFSIWVDGSFRICGNLREYIKKYMKYSNIMFTVHPWRNDVYEETEYSLRCRNFEGEAKMLEQIQCYAQQGMPHQSGVISSGLIIRRHNEKDVIESMEHWWNEICRYSTQDQISFGYIAWKDNLKFDVSTEYIYKNKYWVVEPHCFQMKCFFFEDISLLQDRKVVLYGAGDVGKAYFNQICNQKDIIFAGWVDKNYEKAQLDYYTVTSVDTLKTLEYDNILIAVLDKDIASQIRIQLNEMGIEDKKILWKKPCEGYVGTY